jgi:hypothetical protein
MHHAGTVPLERRSLGGSHPLGRLVDEALAGRGVVELERVIHQRRL